MNTIREAKATLPPPDQAWTRCVALAVLARVHDEEELFTVRVQPDFTHFHLDDGGGQAFDAVFARSGVLLRGFDHESPMSPFVTDDGRSWPGIYDDLPAALVPFVADGERLEDDDDRFPARVGAAEATVTPVTFATWWRRGAWECGAVEFPAFGPHVSDGAGYLLGLVFDPETWIREHGFERAAVECALRHEAVPGSDAWTAWGYGAPYPYFAG